MGYLKKCVAFSNISIEQISEEIETIEAGTSQETTASQVFKINKDGEVPAKYDALIYYKVDSKALGYNKPVVKLPEF